MKTPNAQHPTQPATQPAGHTPGLNWLVVNRDGRIIAALDSESEAYFFTKNRGHVFDATYRKAGCDAASAPDLLEIVEQFVEMDEGRLLYGPMFHDDARSAIARAKGGDV